jgi:hypothetical protein
VLGKGGKQVLKAYTFRAAADSPKYLKRYFSAVSVANNHALDFGPDGLVECLRILAAEGMPQVGGGANLAAARRPLVLEGHGVKVAIVAANGFQAAKSAAGEATPGVAPLEEAAILADIAAAKRVADFVVPFVHWGPELHPQPRARDRALARKMVEAGATAVTCTSVTEECCADLSGSRPSYSCVPEGDCTSLDAVALECATSADCTAGNVCCGYLDSAQSSWNVVVCTRSCTSQNGLTAYVFCNPAAPNACPSGRTCRASQVLSGYGYCQ